MIKGSSFLVIFVLILGFYGCSEEDKLPEEEQFLMANANGINYRSGTSKDALTISRYISDLGAVNLVIKSKSDDGNSTEFMVENFTGAGLYAVGNSTFNKSWMKFDNAGDAWIIKGNDAINSTTNFIEISQFENKRVGGRFSSDGLRNAVVLQRGSMQGDFRGILQN